MTKGYGSIFDDQPMKLSSDELTVLKELFSKPDFNERRNTRTIGEALKWSDRKTDQSLSRLHGMDLIKGGKKSRIFTDEELQLVHNPKNPQYWIGKIGEPIYKRAQHAIENNGNIMKFFYENDFDFDLSLYPKDGRRKTSVVGKIYSFGSVDLSIHHFPLNHLQNDVLLHLRNHEKIKITLETLDE